MTQQPLDIDAGPFRTRNQREDVRLDPTIVFRYSNGLQVARGLRKRKSKSKKKVKTKKFRVETKRRELQ